MCDWCRSRGAPRYRLWDGSAICRDCVASAVRVADYDSFIEQLRRVTQVEPTPGREHFEQHGDRPRAWCHYCLVGLR